MIPREILKKIRQIELRTNRIVQSELLLCLALVLAGCSTARHSVERVGVAEIKIKFSQRQVTPPLNGLPKDVMYPHDLDHREYGPLTNVVAGRISALTVTWADPEIFKSQSQVQTFLRDLLSSTNENTFTWHVWSWGDGTPCVVVKVEHINGKPGKWWVWDAPGLSWAYQDGNGKWWWGSWDYQTPKPKSISPTTRRLGLEAATVESWGAQKNFFINEDLQILPWGEARAALLGRQITGGKQYRTGWVTLHSVNGEKFLTRPIGYDDIYIFFKENNLELKGFRTE